MNWHKHVIKYKGAKNYFTHHRNIRQTDKNTQSPRNSIRFKTINIHFPVRFLKAVHIVVASKLVLFFFIHSDFIATHTILSFCSVPETRNPKPENVQNLINLQINRIVIKIAKQTFKNRNHIHLIDDIPLICSGQWPRAQSHLRQQTI